MPTQLSKEQEEELTEWIDSFELSRSAKRIGRDFSDAGKSYSHVFVKKISILVPFLFHTYSKQSY